MDAMDIDPRPEVVTAQGSQSEESQAKDVETTTGNTHLQEKNQNPSGLVDKASPPHQPEEMPMTPNQALAHNTQEASTALASTEAPNPVVPGATNLFVSQQPQAKKNEKTVAKDQESSALKPQGVNRVTKSQPSKPNVAKSEKPKDSSKGTKIKIIKSGNSIDQQNPVEFTNTTIEPKNVTRPNNHSNATKSGNITRDQAAPKVARPKIIIKQKEPSKVTKSQSTTQNAANVLDQESHSEVVESHGNARKASQGVLGQERETGIQRTLQQNPFHQGNAFASSSQTVAQPARRRRMGDNNSYPRFPDGDVVIICPAGKKSWKLHSTTLRHASTFFNDLLDETPPRAITKKLREEGKTMRWKLIMFVPPEERKRLRFVDFRAVDIENRNHAFPSNPDFLNGLQADPPYYHTYDMFFRALYAMDVGMAAPEEGNNGEQTMYDCMTLIILGERLGARNSIRHIVETKFLRFHQLLWKQVATNPIAWADVAYRLQSPPIFREAMIHVVGQWDLLGGISDAQKRELASLAISGPRIAALATTKARELLDKKIRTERHIVSFYPESMLHIPNPNYLPGRKHYATDVYRWQALTIVRQWITTEVNNRKGYVAADGGLELYRTLGEAGTAYLRQDSLDDFHELFEMSSKGKACLRVALEDMKLEVKEVVTNVLLQDFLQLNRDPDLDHLRYLSCTEIDDDEMPWLED